MKPPSDSPQAITFLVFGYLDLKVLINSLSVARAASVFQPSIEKVEPAIP